MHISITEINIFVYPRREMAYGITAEYHWIFIEIEAPVGSLPFASPTVYKEVNVELPS